MTEEIIKTNHEEIDKKIDSIIKSITSEFIDEKIPTEIGVPALMTTIAVLLALNAATEKNFDNAIEVFTDLLNETKKLKIFIEKKQG